MSDKCSFCGGNRFDVGPFVKGDAENALICGECVGTCFETLAENAPKPARPKLGPPPSPPDVVQHLDQFVIGQISAKRKLAVATTNHYRRLLDEEANSVGKPIVIDPDLREATIEKSNVLLIGPTGCGKTLLARSLAKMLG